MTPGRRGFYEGTDKESRFWRIARHADPALDGLDLLSKDAKPIFDPTIPPDSIDTRAFDRLLEASMPAEVLDRIAHVIAAGKLLAERGLADRPPLDEYEWRRGIILSWCHSRDLELVHQALGHPRFLVGRHDIDECVLAKHLRKSAENADPWYRDYVSSLDDGAWINVGFFNPNLSASLYKWGDARHGVQNAMDAHRLSDHHQGSAEAPLDWVARAVNFVVHHIPREHWGIRHEPRGEYSELEARLADDPAIKDAQIGKVIARDATRMFELLEERGFTVPWGKLKVPEEELTPSVIEHAACILQASRSECLSDPEDAIAPRRVERAKAIFARLPEAIERAETDGLSDLAAAYRQLSIDA